jgi:hypothetical protein
MIEVDYYTNVKLTFRKMGPLPELFAYPPITPGCRPADTRGQFVDDALKIHAVREPRKVELPGGNKAPRCVFTLTADAPVGRKNFGKRSVTVTGFLDTDCISTASGAFDPTAKLYFDRVVTYIDIESPQGTVRTIHSDNHVIAPTGPLDFNQVYRTSRPGDVIQRVQMDDVIKELGREGEQAFDLRSMMTKVRLAPVVRESADQWIGEIMEAFDGAFLDPHNADRTDIIEQMSYACEYDQPGGSLLINDLYQKTDFNNTGYVTIGELVEVLGIMPQMSFDAPIHLKDVSATIEDMEPEYHVILDRIYRATLSGMAMLGAEQFHGVYNGATFIPTYTGPLYNSGVLSPLDPDVQNHILDRMREEYRQAICDEGYFITGLCINCVGGVMNIHLINRGFMPSISIPMFITGRMSCQVVSDQTQRDLSLWVGSVCSQQQVNREED